MSQLNYYQWTPFILLLMGLSLYIPRVIWRVLSVRSGIDLLDLVEAADDSRKMSEDASNREHLITFIVDTLHMYVDDARRQQDSENRQRSPLVKVLQLLCCMTGKFLGNYFITLYMFMK
jgi:innexin